MDSSNWQHDGFALDVLIFIDISSNLGEISSTAARATSQIGLVYSVKFVYENIWASTLTLLYIEFQAVMTFST